MVIQFQFQIFQRVRIHWVDKNQQKQQNEKQTDHSNVILNHYEKQKWFAMCKDKFIYEHTKQTYNTKNHVKKYTLTSKNHIIF